MAQCTCVVKVNLEEGIRRRGTENLKKEESIEKDLHKSEDLEIIIVEGGN